MIADILRHADLTMGPIVALLVFVGVFVVVVGRTLSSARNETYDLMTNLPLDDASGKGGRTDG